MNLLTVASFPPDRTAAQGFPSSATSTSLRWPRQVLGVRRMAARELRLSRIPAS